MRRLQKFYVSPRGLLWFRYWQRVTCLVCRFPGNSRECVSTGRRQQQHEPLWAQQLQHRASVLHTHPRPRACVRACVRVALLLVGRLSFWNAASSSIAKWDLVTSSSSIILTELRAFISVALKRRVAIGLRVQRKRFDPGDYMCSASQMERTTSFLFFVRLILILDHLKMVIIK
jgi:hypothetical protein